MSELTDRPTDRPASWMASAAALALAAPLAVLGLGTAPAAAQGPQASDEDLVADGIFATAETDPVAPGLDVTRFSRLEAEGWTAGSLLRADLDTETLSVDVVNSGSVSEPITVPEHVERSGAVAAVNGDFFDINYSNAARGTAIGAGGMLNGTNTPYPGVAIAHGVAAVGQIATDASVTLDGAEHLIAGVNTPHLAEGGIGLYTTGWGEHTLDRPVGGPDELADNVAHALVSDGVITEIGAEPGQIDIAEDTTVLLGREDGAQALQELELGAQVEVDIEANVPADAAITGNEVLLADGVVVASDENVHPRTAVGVGPDGSELFVLALDGRAHFGRGMSTPELAELLLEMGAHDAVNLDGGGSTTMVARTAGAAEAEVMNVPSDGDPRPVPNALAFFSSAEPGTLQNLQLEPVSQHTGAHRLLPGLQRTVAATGLDANYAPVDVTGEFSATGTVEITAADAAQATVVGQRRGHGEVGFTDGNLRSGLDLEVLGTLDHVRADRNLIALESAEDSHLVHLIGYDADGHGAPVETADMDIDTPEGLTAEPEGTDAIRVGAQIHDGAGTITVTVDEQPVELAVTVGAEEVDVLDLADGADWTTGSDRATGTMEPAEGPEPGTHGLGLDYDFASDSGTRGFYAIAPEPVELPGQPQSVTMWLNGSGDGEWPRLQMTNGDGTTINLDGDLVTWEGWQQVSFPVPEGTPYPLTFERVRMMETRPDAQYHGEVTVGPMSVVLSADVDPPAVDPVHDPVIVTDGSVADRPVQIAVMSDAQFVARDPDSDIVEAARRTFAEIVAAEPDLLVINGDLVDEAAPEDFALARTILTEEVGDAVPWLYVPGNHEIMGGPIENFIDEFGPTRQAITVEGTRIITLDSSTGTLAGGGLDQLAMLESELDTAATDPQITGVMVFAHHPTRDPLPTQASQLTDREEAAALEQALADFRAESGRSAALISGHVGVFHARSSEGVSYLVNGNSGKGPSGTADNGGFTGWTMLGVDPAQGHVGDLPDVPGPRLDWMQAEVNPRVDELVLSGEQTLQIGDQVAIDAHILQDDGHQVPLGWPMTAQWGGAQTTLDDGGITEATSAEDRQVSVRETRGRVVRFNPATGILTAISPGEAVLEVTVNGEREQLPITVQDRRSR
ncbi:MAG TPA: phosphodiester glycosidase family protein [Beutenbergiaceae bacterium]|nr:phosphodiester glycosidase family protein [Beutenbergiaceae bacterium]